MAEVTPAIRRAYGLAASLVPTDILAQLPQAELGDRLEYAKTLVAKSQAATSPTERRALAEQARNVLRAQPRSETERETQALISKAAALPGRSGQADACRRKAQDLLALHPPAPRRTPEEQARDAGPVSAGGATGLGQPRAAGPQRARPGDYPGRDVIKARPLTPVYDDRHRLTGVVAPGSIRQRVSKAGKDVVMQPVFDENGNLVGIVDPADVQPVAGASKKPAPAAEPAEQPAADVAKAVFARAFLAGWRDAARAARTPAPRRPGQG